MFRDLRPLAATAVVCLASVAPAVHAQMIDDVEYRRDGADAVLQVRFVTEIQYQRAALARSGDFTQAFYLVLPTRQSLNRITSERRVPARDGDAGKPGLPAILITDEATSGAAGNERRLVVRLATPVAHRVRAGRGNRTIEIVIDGGGDYATATRAMPAAEPEGRWRVTLQRSQAGGSFLEAPIPASLQQQPVYTTSRVVDGQVLYDTHLGRFATRAEAEAVLATLSARFATAAVTEAAAPTRVDTTPPTPPAPVAVTAPPVPVEPAAAPAVVSAPAAPATPAPAADDPSAAALLADARAALARGDAPGAVELLSKLLDLPPNASSREAQALIGDARKAAGDARRARSEYDVYLKLHPDGPEADHVRAALATLPATPERAKRHVEPTTTLSGSVSAFYYGGQSKVRTQEFQDSPLSGLPELVSDASLSAADQRQLVGSVDVNWRHRDAEVEQRFVLRDAYTTDFLRSDKTKNKLSQLYFDQRSFTNGTSFRIGRQSPLGGGVLSRFDGAQAGYAFRPRWKANVVAGIPTDTLLDSNRYFYGASVDAEALTPQFGGSLYVMQQVVDGEVDRRAIGTDLRYFDGGISATGQFDYDLVLKGLNIASLQGTWQREDNTVVNVLYDRRKQPMLMLGNALFFTDPALTVRPTRIADLLATKTLQELRDQVVATTALSTQAAVAVTTPINAHWQIGGDVRYTNTGAILPVPDILPTGLPSTGDIWSLGAQAIGSNLYSARDTHVFIFNAVSGPTFKGQLLSYNNSSLVAEAWQLEPSFKFYTQSDNTGTKSTRWTPGLRVTYRLGQQAAVESEVSVEQSKVTGPTRNESATRVFYFLGGRYDF